MKASLLVVWRWVKWPLIILAVGYIALVLVRVVMLFDEEKTANAVAEIHAQRITFADVNGEYLPPMPDEAENNATVAGVDKNNNGIRDDVELKIFEKYPNDKKTRAAALQYAMELQMEFTRVFNSETLVAVIQEEGRGSVCVLNNIITDWVEDMIVNTDERRLFQEDIYKRYMTSYALPNSDFCDIQI